MTKIFCRMDSKESITLRLAKLNQQIDGKCPSGSTTPLLSKEALLDSLVALYDECERKVSHERKSPPKHVSTFVRKGMIIALVQKVLLGECEITIAAILHADTNNVNIDFNF